MARPPRKFAPARPPASIPCSGCGVLTFAGRCRRCAWQARKLKPAPPPAPRKRRWGPSYWTPELCEKKGHVFKWMDGQNFARCVYCGAGL